MKIAKKVIMILILSGLIMLTFSSISNAGLLKDISTQTNEFIQIGSNEFKNANSVTDTFATDLSELGQILTFIGVGVVICVTTYLGIQYFIAPPDKQGAIKEKLIGLVVAIFVILGAWGIWKIAINIFSNLD